MLTTLLLLLGWAYVSHGAETIYKVDSSGFLKVTCTDLVMKLDLPTLQASQPSIGKIYIQNQETTSGCFAAKTENFSIALTFNRDVCGYSAFSKTTTINLFFTAINTDIRSSFDGIYTVTCMGVFKGIVEVTNELESVVTRSPEENFRENIVAVPNKTAPPLKLHFYTPSTDTELVTTVVDTTVEMRIEVAGVNKDVYSLMALVCTAYDAYKTESSKLLMYSGRCPTPTYRDVLSISKFSRKNSNQYVIVSTFKAFSFVSAVDDTVIFVCTVQVCPKDDLDCKVPTCASRRRRSLWKRAAENEYEVESRNITARYIEDISSIIYVARPKMLPQAPAPKPINDLDIPPLREIPGYVLILTSILAALTLGSCAIMSVVLCRRKRRSSKKDAHLDDSLHKKFANESLSIHASPTTHL